MYNDKTICSVAMLDQSAQTNAVTRHDRAVTRQENWPNWVTKLREVKGEMCNGLADQWFSKHVAPPQNNTIG